jgi:predicted ATP-grasp superfamily ATP-dependent carboligase
MRILVFEFASGGGLAGRPVPRSLAREGRAMLSALVADLARIGRHEIVTTADRRFTLRAPRGVDVVTIRRGGAALLDDLIASVDAVWLIAPETDGWLEGLAAKVERTGRMLLGTGSAAIRRAADKRRLPHRLARCGLAHPPTRVVHRHAEARAIADDLGYPVIVKPARGAGCEGVRLAGNGRELRAAIQAVGRRGFEVAQAFRPAIAALTAFANASALKKRSATQNVLVQRYIPGVAASVSLLSDGRRAVALAANGQAISAGSTLSYAGGRTPLDHPLAERAIDAAIRTCEAFPGLHGYVGVDLVLTSADAVVIEINPRLTTAYLGVRSAINRHSGSGNIAEMAIDACAGNLPARPRIARHVRFTSAGRVVSL